MDGPDRSAIHLQAPLIVDLPLGRNREGDGGLLGKMGIVRVGLKIAADIRDVQVFIKNFRRAETPAY